jgi:hypothetical protein
MTTVMDVTGCDGFSRNYSLYLLTRESFRTTHHIHHNPSREGLGKATGQTRTPKLTSTLATGKGVLLPAKQGVSALSANKMNSLQSKAAGRGNARGNNAYCRVVPDLLTEARKSL